jgi:hypothetical protein
MSQAFRAASGYLNGLSIALTKPAGTVSGDTLLFMGSSDDGAATLTVPSGFTVGATIHLTHNDTQTGFWAWKNAGGSEPATYTFGTTLGTEGLGGALVCYSGCDGTTPIDGTPTTNSLDLVTPTVNVSASATGFTTTNIDMIVGFYFADGDNTLTWGAPAAMTAREQQSADGLLTPFLMADFLQTSAGAVSAQVATYAQIADWGAFLIALKAPSGSDTFTNQICM